MAPPRELKIIATSSRLQLVAAGHWEFARRTGVSGVVSIAALTRQGSMLFVEQYRAPVDARVVELPAGLAGDSRDDADEPLAQAALRELAEETGYRPGSLRRVFSGPSSAGLTDEIVSFFVALDAVRVGAGGGVEGENIVVHEIPLADVDRWLDEKSAAGCLVCARVPTGIHLLKRELSARDQQQQCP